MNKASIIKSWKTTLAGIMQFLILVWNQVQLLWDDDLATNPDWGMLFSSLIILIGLLTARDSNVSSEAAGAKQSGALAEKQRAING